MDPDETLAALRAAARAVLARETNDHQTEELAEAASNLDEWLSRGGFLPRAWKKARSVGPSHPARVANDASRRHVHAIMEEAARVGWPRTMTRDLTKWDRRALEKRDACWPFVWVLRETGTHLIFPEATRKGSRSESPESIVRAVADIFGEASCRFYAWDGAALHALANAAAAEDFVRTFQWSEAAR